MSSIRNSLGSKQLFEKAAVKNLKGANDEYLRSK